MPFHKMPRHSRGAIRLPRPDKLLGLMSAALIVGGIACIGVSQLWFAGQLRSVGEWIVAAGVAIFSLPATFILLALPVSFVWQKWIRRN